MAVGAGLGAGIMMVLAADTAPVYWRVQFSGLWRLLGDLGNSVGPGAVSIGAAAWTTAGGITGIGVIGILTTAGLINWIP